MDSGYNFILGNLFGKKERLNDKIQLNLPF